ncbi:hypothetical protein [Dysgonomonas sp.]
MKIRHKLLILLMLSSISLFSQSIDDLDTRNGFNQFKLGDSYIKWQSDLKPTGFKFHMPNTELYFYTGNCCSSLFGFKIEGIFMTFQNNKLVEISIDLDRERERQDTQYMVDCQNRLKSVLNSLVALYGTPQSIKEPKDLVRENPTYILGWIGEKVILKVEHSFIFKGGSGCKTRITVSNREWLFNTYKPEF